MNKKYSVLILLIFILGISAVSATSQNVTDYGNDDVVNEYVENLNLNTQSEIIGESNSSIDYDFVENNSSSDENTKTYENSSLSNNSSLENEGAENTNETVSVILQGNDLVKYSKSNLSYKFKLIDSKGNPISNETVKLLVNGKYYYQKTNADGSGSLKITLAAGNYVIKAYYGNLTISNDIVVFKSRISQNKDLSATYGTKVKYSLKVVDDYGNMMDNKLVTFKIGKKVYKIKTNAKGIATLNLNYNSGNYVIYYSVDNLSGHNKYVVKNKISISVLNWGNKGDVSKVKLIKKNMPNNAWVKKAVAATKKGIPLLTFKGGSGKISFITSGVHGNELSSQVAAMKLIKYLTDHPIKGTVYVMPFVNPKAISSKVRYTDVDYNRVAAKSNTISNKIVKLVKKYKCDYYGDFHTTQPGGIPGKNVVMGSKNPNTKSYKLTNYISKNCKVDKIVYSYAGQKYPGAIADNVNKNKIPAVLCEVMLPHNTVTTKTVNLSLSMMKYLLKYSSII